MNWYLEGFRKFDTVQGRSRRKEFWMFFLINIIILIAIGFGQRFIGMRIPLIIYGLIALAPYLCVSVRRLHDINFSGWWLLLYFVPGGVLALLIMFVLPGSKGDNKYGADPKWQP